MADAGMGYQVPEGLLASVKGLPIADSLSKSLAVQRSPGRSRVQKVRARGRFKNLVVLAQDVRSHIRQSCGNRRSHLVVVQRGTLILELAMSPTDGYCPASS